MPPSKQKAKARSKRPDDPSPIPPGFGTVTAYLSVMGGLAAIEFYKKAFGAHEVVRRVTPNGKLIHGQLRIGDSMVFVSDIFPDSETAAPSSIGTTTVTLHIYSENVDALWDRAVAAGAKVSMPLENQVPGASGTASSSTRSGTTGPSPCGSRCRAKRWKRSRSRPRPRSRGTSIRAGTPGTATRRTATTAVHP